MKNTEQHVYLHKYFPKIIHLFYEDMRRYRESDSPWTYYNFNSIGVLEEYFNYESGLMLKRDERHFLEMNRINKSYSEEFAAFLTSYGFYFSNDDILILMLIVNIIQRKDWAQIGSANDIELKKGIYEIISSEITKQRHADRRANRRKGIDSVKLEARRPNDVRPTIYGEWIARLFDWIGEYLNVKQKKRRFILIGLLLETGGFDELRNYHESRKNPSKEKKLKENGDPDLLSSEKKYEDYIAETLKRIYYYRQKRNGSMS